MLSWPGYIAAFINSVLYSTCVAIAGHDSMLENICRNGSVIIVIGIIAALLPVLVIIAVKAIKTFG